MKIFMSKKTIGWVIGSIVVLGAGGYALARYNTDSMAHVIYQEVTHTESTAASSSTAKEDSVKVVTDTNTNKKPAKATTGKTQSASLNDIQKILSSKNYTGAYVISENGKISQTDFTGKNANQMNGKFYLATDTENMLTAAAILHLVDQGKLKLSTPISKYFSSLSTSNKVTVQTLLDMTSGLSNDSIPSNQLTNVLNWNIDHAEAGSTGQYNYQEINYVLLEGIVSQVTNQSYQDYITNTFLQPNGLNEVKFASQVDSSKMATPYNNGQPVSDPTLAKAMNSQMGQNQLVASPWNLLKLTQVLVKEYGNNPNFISSQPTGRLIKNGDMYYVSGGIVGYRTSIAISKDGKKGVVLMSNDSNGKDNLTSLVKEAYGKLK